MTKVNKKEKKKVQTLTKIIKPSRKLNRRNKGKSQGDLTKKKIAVSKKSQSDLTKKKIAVYKKSQSDLTKKKIAVGKKKSQGDLTKKKIAVGKKNLKEI